LIELFNKSVKKKKKKKKEIRPEIQNWCRTDQGWM